MHLGNLAETSADKYLADTLSNANRKMEETDREVFYPQAQIIHKKREHQRTTVLGIRFLVFDFGLDLHQGGCAA